jgi:hypothetical protein
MTETERMAEKSEHNQNEAAVSLGEPSFLSPYGHRLFGDSEDGEIFARARIRDFSRSVLSPDAWFHTANELIAAMDLLEPHVERFWEDVRSVSFAFDQTTDPPSKHQKSDVPQTREESEPPKHSLINQHMMLAGFAIENLCKGYLASQLSYEQREAVQKAGDLPKSLQGHDIVKLVEQMGMTLSDTDKYLLNRITDAVLWRGRYPSALSHEQLLRRFEQIGSDIRHVKTLLQRVRRHVGAKS